MAEAFFVSLLATVGIFMLPSGNGFLGGSGMDARCYRQTCNISMTALQNTEAILSGMSSGGNDMSSVVAESEARVKTNVTDEMASYDLKIKSEIENVTGFLTNAINIMKAEILADISDGCAEGFSLSQAQSIVVILDIYSGVKNPTWTVSASVGDFNTILGLLRENPSTEIPVLAGYRGFMVTVVRSDGSDVVYTYGQGRQVSTTLETTLLSSSGGSLGGAVESVVTAAINGQAPPDLGFTGPLAPDAPQPSSDQSCAKRRPCPAPSYLPSDWVTDSLKLITNNCYNYAVNIPSNMFPRPGGSGTALTGEAIRNACVQEGMEDFSDPAAGVFPDTHDCLTALVIMENLDFHFYRLDSDGTWSHKLGEEAPSNLDNDGNTITDPRTANIGPYQFVRFMGICTRKFLGYT